MKLQMHPDEKPCLKSLSWVLFWTRTDAQWDWQVGMQNSSLGVVLATIHFASPLTAVPAAVSAVLMNIMGSGLAVVWRQIRIPTSLQ
jgi:hypothetical protein